ncbi:MAG: hypothetical protein ACFFD4_38680 [Candidatus Odinarchaeota archaeon]
MNNKCRSYKPIIFLILVILAFSGSIEVIQTTANVEFSEEDEKIFEHSRVSFGYDAILVNNSDVIVNCWAELEDKGDYDVKWKEVFINYSIKDLKESKVKNLDRSLPLGEKVESDPIKVDTPYDDLNESDLGLKITFSFFEVDGSGDIHEYAFTKNYSTDFFGIILLPVLTGLSLIKIKKRSQKQG